MFKKMRVSLDDGALLPKRAYEFDAGLDLFSPVDFVVPAHGYAFVDIGVHVELPYGTRGHVCSKSGLNRFHGLTADGTVDQGYTNSIGVTVHNDDSEDYHFRRGDKVAQLVVEPIYRPEIEVVDRIDGGDRGDNGYGSSGR